MTVPWTWLCSSGYGYGYGGTCVDKGRRAQLQEPTCEGPRGVILMTDREEKERKQEPEIPR